ncbi:MAG: hypothetical protein HN855_08150 [Anaerolineae bacterium]|jgi:hypothetical protein|nr:hypothetical protein [Anaerolineae bacterium]MBT7069483.1 hypothetical protein [Anaerolineae bacterium]MBT7325114.1 hypothetical protein [Anaerolineae bacterium]
MKKLVLFLITFALLLTACKQEVSATPTATDESVSAEAIFTAAAMTAFAQIPTATLVPTETATAVPTATVAPTITPVATVTPQNIATKESSSLTAFGCYDAAFGSDVTIPDGTFFDPGDAFTKTWEIKNTGGCEWEADFQLIFSSGDQMSGTNNVINTTVASGETGVFSVNLIAPDTPGGYTGYWRLTNAEGTIFGEAVYVVITVDGEIPTATVTP